MVANGGFSSCFEQANWVVRAAIAGLRALGDPDAAHIVASALAASTTATWRRDDGDSWSKRYWGHREAHALEPLLMEAVGRIVAKAGPFETPTV